MLLAAAHIQPKSAVLEMGCAGGTLTAQIAPRLDGESRIVAVDASPALLDLARSRLTADQPLGRRAFFRAQPVATKLPFAEETFETVLANVALDELADPATTLADYARVARPGGQVVIATPLRGTWQELLDLYREVLVASGQSKALAALDAYIDSIPDAEQVARFLEGAGLAEVDIEVRRWELVFRSAREFFYAPVIEHGPLPRWKEIVDRDHMHDTFVAIKEAIDTYFAGRAFAVTVLGARFAARKPS
jgi:ubiquinone/menaquinone biosynthesis C-methylase UbiE